MKLSTTPLAVALLATGTNAFFGAKEPPKPKPHIIEDFKFVDPFGLPDINNYETDCEVTRTLPAREFSLADLSSPSPKGLREWSPGLKKLFTGREYPGSWGGLDRHGNDRMILSMEYKDVPLEVRLWIEEQERTSGEGKGLFGIFEKLKPKSKTEGDEEEKVEEKIDDTVAIPSAKEVDRSLDESRVLIFAPGAIYHILPLWAVEASACKGMLSLR